jgi:hypothetical protein
MTKHFLILLALSFAGNMALALDLQFEKDQGLCIYQGSYKASDPNDERDGLQFELVSQALEGELSDGSLGLLKTIGLGSKMQAPKAWAVFYDMGNGRFQLAAPDSAGRLFNAVNVQNILGTPDVIVRAFPTEHDEIVHFKVYTIASDQNARRQLQGLTLLHLELQGKELSPSKKASLEEEVLMLEKSLKLSELKPLGELNLALKHCNSREEQRSPPRQRTLL